MPCSVRYNEQKCASVLYDLGNLPELRQVSKVNRLRLALDCSLARGGIGRGGNRFARVVESAVDLLSGERRGHPDGLDVVKFDLVHWGKSSEEYRTPVRLSRIPGGIKRALWARGGGWKLGIAGTKLLGMPHVVHTVEFRLVRVSRAKLVYSLFDLPWVRGFHYSSTLKPLIEDSLRRADVIMAISECTAQDAMELGIPESRIRQVYPALESFYLDHGKQPLRVKDLMGGFLLFVGSCQSPNKNFRRIIEAMELARIDLPLVVAGPDDPTLDSLHSRVSVMYMGHVSNETLLSLYDHATALVFPSVFEGFGYPVVEAMARGCPVLTSSSGSLREVAGDAAIFVDPMETDDIARGLRQVMDTSQTAALVQRGYSRAEYFSLRRLARNLLSVYSE